MKTIKTKHILIILAVGFFILVFVNEEKNTNPYSYTPSKSQSSYPSFDNVETYNSFQQKTHPNLNRNEVLQTKVKGYREATYWGAEHPIDEKVKYLNDDEFKQFVKDEIEEKDADLYWGTEY